MYFRKTGVWHLFAITSFSPFCRIWVYQSTSRAMSKWCLDCGIKWKSSYQLGMLLKLHWGNSLLLLGLWMVSFMRFLSFLDVDMKKLFIDWSIYNVVFLFYSKCSTANSCMELPQRSCLEEHNCLWDGSSCNDKLGSQLFEHSQTYS